MTAPPTSWDVITRIGPVAFSVDGVRFSIRERTVGQWAVAILSGDLEDVLPGLLPPEQYEAWVQVVWNPDRVFTRELHARIVGSAITAATAMPPAAVEGLLRAAAGHWRELDGWAAGKNLDLLALPLHRFCHLMYQRVIEHATEADRFRIDAELFAPPPDADPDRDTPPGWGEAEESAAFASAMAAFAAATGAAAHGSRATPAVR